MAFIPFEDAFSNFIDRYEYDHIQNEIFGMVRTSFRAGWESAGGIPPKSQPVFQLLTNDPVELPKPEVAPETPEQPEE